MRVVAMDRKNTIAARKEVTQCAPSRDRHVLNRGVSLQGKDVTLTCALEEADGRFIEISPKRTPAWWRLAEGVVSPQPRCNSLWSDTHMHTHATRRNRHPPKTYYDIGWRMRRGCSGCLPGGGSRSNGQTDPQNWCNRKHVRLGPDKQCVCIDTDNLGPSKPDSVIVFTTDSECKNNSEMRTSQPPAPVFFDIGIRHENMHGFWCTGCRFHLSF